jgi:hypothetical protein
MPLEPTQYIQKCLQTSAELSVLKTTDPQGKPFHKRLIFSELERLTNKFQAGDRDERWLVMLGMRGVGKSTLLHQTYRHLTETLHVNQKDILCFSMSDAFGQLAVGLDKTVQSFEDLRGTRLGSERTPIYLLVDEAHHDPKWAESAKEIYERVPNVFLLITGSSALSLQDDGDLEADKARRVNWLHVTPLKYVEFLLLHDGVDFTDLSGPVTQALFRSASGSEVVGRLSSLRNRLLEFQVHCDDLKVRKYLTQGGLPYAINLPPVLAYDRIIRTTNAVIEKDLTLLKRVRFESETIRKFPQLLTLLATWENVSLDKLAGSALNIEKPTLIQMLDALRKCELIKSIKTHGGVRIKATRPPRYVFGSTNVKAAFRWNVGAQVITPADFGVLLEDLMVQYFETGDPGQPIAVYRRDGTNEADFILETPLKEIIICEIGFGRKTTEQVRNTMNDKDVKAKYGLTIADEPLGVSPDGDIAIVPKEYLLAC